MTDQPYDKKGLAQHGHKSYAHITTSGIRLPDAPCVRVVVVRPAVTDQVLVAGLRAGAWDEGECAESVRQLRDGRRGVRPAARVRPVQLLIDQRIQGLRDAA